MKIHLLKFCKKSVFECESCNNKYNINQLNDEDRQKALDHNCMDLL